MISVQLDRQSSLNLVWPRKDDDIIALGDAWVAFEASRSIINQLKDITYTLMQTKLDAAKAARASAQTGEAARTITTGDYRATLTAIRTNLERALAFLKYKHADNLLLIENHGWNVRHTARGGLTVKMPQTDGELLLLLERYVAYESTLGAAQQITDPSLATMQGLLVDAQDLAQNRRSSRVQRSSNVQARTTAALELLDLLQIAALVISALEFSGKLDPALGNWGYTLVATQTKAGEPPEEVPA